MTATITHTNPNALKKVYERLSKAKGREVAVGFPAGMAQAYPDGTPVAQVAAWNVYGVPENNIPARDFMAFARVDIIRDLKAVVEKIRGKDLSDAGKDTFLKTLGQMAKQDIQKAIVDLNDPPNAPSTIARKLKKLSKKKIKMLEKMGVPAGGVKPLVDTGHMYQSVTFIVRDSTKEKA